MFCKESRFSVILKLIILLGISILGIIGCNQKVILETPNPISGGFLTPYLTTTASPTPSLEIDGPKPSPVPTEIPLPTPTPFIYTVVADDTLTGIAVRYSVSLEDLISANPGLDPNFLTIGLTLTIPIDDSPAAILPAPTPIPIILRTPDCYLLADEQLYCLVMVENNQQYAVENVIVQVSLQSTAGEILATKSAIPPLNLIPAGRTVAVPAIFAAQTSQDLTPIASLLTVIPVVEDTNRYLQVDLQTKESILSSDGLQAQVHGSISLMDAQTEATTVWIAAFAYDENENIVGLRKWISNDVLEIGEQINFDLTVYSLGPKITRLDLIAETRP